MAEKTWQITADVVFPNHFPVEMVDGVPQFPTTLQPQSRIPVQMRDFDGVAVYICPGDDSAVSGVQEDLRFAVATIVVRINGDVADAQSAVDAAMPYLDRVLESLSFQMQAPLPIEGLQVLDLTGSPEVGDKRHFVRWSKYATPTFWPASVPMDSVVGRLSPDLGVELDGSDNRTNRALDWYLKALNARFEADRFIFLWIATEILAVGSGFEVRKPYSGPACKHEIPNCPECGAETTKRVQGATMRRFLTQGFGVDEEVARQLWKARQMLHGAHDFDSEIMRRLAELSQHLQTAVILALKHRLGIPDEERPFAVATGLSIVPFAGIEGEREITPRDLSPLAESQAA